eukprot:GHVL01011118.1.p1 GENE.GHVL01011118.1~~GHVL01011118.1.p1  ORF type:complete len:270 (+),score=18.13 GHVL01011118.1:106-915(+)
MDDFFTKVGSFSKFQICAWSLVLIPCAVSNAFVSVGHVLFALPVTRIKDGVIVADGDCSGNWKYYNIHQSIQSEFNLGYCDHDDHGYGQRIISLTLSIFFFGVFVGALMFGFLGDIMGRKLPIITSCVGMIFSSFICAISPNIFIFVIGRFFQGVFSSGLSLCSYTYCVETTTPKYRSLATLVATLAFALSEIVIALYSYFVPFWRLQFMFYIIPVICPLILWSIGYFPESPRILLTNGEISATKSSMYTIAHINKKKRLYTTRWTNYY